MFGMLRKNKGAGATEKPDRPKVYVTYRGGLYVKIDELLNSKEGDRLMAQLREIDERITRKGEPPDKSADKQKTVHQRLPED